MSDGVIRFKKTHEDNPDGKMCCDFCNEPDPTMAFPARAFIMSLVTPEGSYTQDYGDDGWAACAWCAPLAEANDVPRLVERYFLIHPMLPQMGPRERAFLRGLVSTQFDLFVEHRDGPPTPITTAATPGPTA